MQTLQQLKQVLLPIEECIVTFADGDVRYVIYDDHVFSPPNAANSAGRVDICPAGGGITVTNCGSTALDFTVVSDTS